MKLTFYIICIIYFKLHADLNNNYNLAYVMQRKASYLAMAAVIASIVAVAGTGNRAYAATLVPLPPGVIADGIAAFNTPYNLGQQGDIYVCIVSTSRQITDIKLVDPNNIFHNYVGAPVLPITLPSGGNQCLHLTASDFGLYSGFNVAGEWTVLVDTVPGRSYTYEFVVTFMAVPESVIGALAVVLPSIGAFAGYKVLRSKSK
jgi:hypothetical protein